jgi:hypothetical protein
VGASSSERSCSWSLVRSALEADVPAVLEREEVPLLPQALSPSDASARTTKVWPRRLIGLTIIASRRAPHQPRPTNGISEAITVMDSTFALSGRLTMYRTASATCSADIVGSARIEPSA